MLLRINCSEPQDGWLPQLQHRRLNVPIPADQSAADFAVFLWEMANGKQLQQMVQDWADGVVEGVVEGVAEAVEEIEVKATLLR